VSRELGVRYVLEGSVRKAANRVRITGQLIDAATGAHIWADRFDGDYDDIFDLQDRITSQVVGAIEPRIRAAEIERARRRRPDSLEAYDLYLRALPHAYASTPEGNIEAVDLLERAIALDPGFAPAAAMAAWCYQQRATFAWEFSTGSDAERAVDHAQTAIAADKDDANSLALAGFVLAIVGHDMARSRMAVERAMELNSNDPSVQGFSGHVRTFLGDQDGALSCFEMALRLSPGDPMAFAFLHGSATAHLLAGRYEEAVGFATKAAHENSNFNPIFRVLAASYAQLGKMEEARKAVGRLLELDPRIGIAHLRANLPYQDRTQFERLLDGLRMAGLPE
jgi:tetratricopeptide (TPR) repeat protein